MADVALINARVLTLADGGADAPRRGTAMRTLGVIDHGYIQLASGKIHSVGEGEPANNSTGRMVDVEGRVVMPCFVDCHTHACWAGSRLDEFEQSLAGASYLDILNAGGGIMSTVRAVRAVSQRELMANLMHRLRAMAKLGTGTVEVKSGYGLDTDAELKMLRAIHEVADVVPQAVVGTFLGAHAIDPDNPKFVDQTINETLPRVVDEFPSITCDAYCERGAWSVKDVERLFDAAKRLGCRLRVHTDQFNSLGMTRLAIDMDALSVDHLEAVTPKDIDYLAKSNTIGVLLPCSGFHLDDRYAPGREMIDSGAAIAIATNYNPGSAPTPSMLFAIALACRKLGMTVAEAITAATHNAACVLGLQNLVGTLTIGKRADIQVLDAADERELGYEFAGPGPWMTVINGTIVRDPHSHRT